MKGGGLMDLVGWGAQDLYLCDNVDISDHPTLVKLRNRAGPVAHDIEKIIRESDDNVKVTINKIHIIQENTGKCWEEAALILINKTKQKN